MIFTKKSTITFLCTALFICCAALKTEGAERSNDFTEVAKKAIPAVVSIQVKLNNPSRSSVDVWGNQNNDDFSDPLGESFFRFFGIPREQKKPVSGFGTGFLVSEDGLILTNAHLVKDAQDIRVTQDDGREFEAKVIGVDPSTDVAIVKIDGKDLPFLKLGNSDELQVGQWVVAIGNPFGLRATLTAGVVSAKDRNNLDIARIEDFIQTDAAINQGNSGGPLLTTDAEVVGMNTALATSIQGGGYMGIGFAIPSNLIQHVMEELISTGSVSRGFLGITLQNVDHDLSQAFGLKKIEGALITDVAVDSPAAKSNLQQGDIIIKFNGQPVANMSRLRNAILLMKPGTKATLGILRNGREQSLDIVIGELPGFQGKTGNAHMNLGIQVEPLSPESARKLNMEGQEGVMVSKVDPNSPAAWAGIRRGTVIISVNQQRINSIDEYQKAIAKAEKGKPILLLIKQGEASRFVSIKIN